MGTRESGKRKKEKRKEKQELDFKMSPESTKSNTLSS